MIKLILPGKPIQWKRAEIAPKSSWRRKTNLPHLFDPQKSEKESVRLLMSYQLSKQPNSTDFYNLEDHQSYSVSIHCYLPSQRLSQENQNLSQWGLVPMTAAPDVDNLVKFYLDCANGLIWPDDALIEQLWVKKHYVSEEWRVEMTVWKDSSILNDCPEIKKIFSYITPKDVEDMKEQLDAISTSPQVHQDQFIDIELLKIAENLFKFSRAWGKKLQGISKCNLNQD